MTNPRMSAAAIKRWADPEYRKKQQAGYRLALTGDLYPEEFRQKAILRFIDERERSGQTLPSVREIGRAVGLKSASTTHQHLQNLYRRGLIDWEPKIARSIRLHRQDDVCPACGGTGRRIVNVRREEGKA